MMVVLPVVYEDDEENVDDGVGLIIWRLENDKVYKKTAHVI